MTDFEQWKGFEQGKWCDDIDTRDFILKNYTLYDGDESHSCGTNSRNKQAMGKTSRASEASRAKGGVPTWTPYRYRYQRS